MKNCMLLFFSMMRKRSKRNALALVKLLKFAKSKLDEIKANNEREGNNQNYHIVSSALLYIVNTFDVGPKYNAYSCPMIKRNVQNTQKMAKRFITLMLQRCLIAVHKIAIINKLARQRNLLICA